MKESGHTLPGLYSLKLSQNESSTVGFCDFENMSASQEYVDMDESCKTYKILDSETRNANYSGSEQYCDQIDHYGSRSNTSPDCSCIL